MRLGHQALLAACGLALVLPSASQAWTAQIGAGTLQVAGSPGEVNKLKLSDATGGAVEVQDDLAPFQGPVPAGCTLDAPTIDCPQGTVQRVVARGQDGNDRLETDVTPIPVTLAGGDGNDTVEGGDAAETLTGDAGDDKVDGGAGNDSLDGGAGADRLDGGEGLDALQGGSEADRLDGGDGNDVLHGGEGNDRLTSSDGNDAAFGDGGADSVEAGDDGGLVDGGEGEDTLKGGSGNDMLDGGPGNDALDGDDKNDTLLGGVGNDSMMGGDGNDALDGGEGDDSLNGQDGANSLGGGAGTDTLTYTDSNDGVTVSVDGQANDGALGQGDNVGDDVERLIGSPNDDLLSAGGALHDINGDSGGDLLQGSAQADRLDGGGDDDILRGGPGADALIGSGGADVVTYSERRRAVRVTLADGLANDGEKGEADSVDRSVEGAEGGPGADRITGTKGVENQLVGGAGADVLTDAGHGDKAEDTFSCGAGGDSVHADHQDKVARDCETLYEDQRASRYGVAAPGRPTLAVSAGLIGLAGRHGLIRVSCGLQARHRCLGRLVLQKFGRTLGRFRLNLASGSVERLSLRLSRSQLALLMRRAPHGTRLRLRLSAAGGGTIEGSVPLDYRRAKPKKKSTGS